MGALRLSSRHKANSVRSQVSGNCFPAFQSRFLVRELFDDSINLVPVDGELVEADSNNDEITNEESPGEEVYCKTGNKEDWDGEDENIVNDVEADPRKNEPLAMNTAHDNPAEHHEITE